nr:sister-chromatid cohesion protein 3 [Tanacetum cinerariifolium]
MSNLRKILFEIGVPQARFFLGCSFTGYREEYHQLRGFRGRNNLVGTKIGHDALINYSKDIQSHQEALRSTLIKLDAIDAFTNNYNINIQYDTRSAVADGRLAYDRANLDLSQKLDYFRDPNNCNKFKHNSKYATAMVGLRTIVIKRNGKQIQQVVKFWVEQYEKDSKPAVVELLTMMFEAFGAKYCIQGEFLHKINKRLSETHEKITMIEDMMRKIFTGHQLVLDDDLRLGLLYDLLINNPLPPEIRRAIKALAYDHVIAQKFNSSLSRSTG